MFMHAKVLEPEGRSIVVQTRQGTNIKNLIEPEIGVQQRNLYEALLKRYGRNWIRRKPATTGYNCAGHVWASRRTALFDPKDWNLILVEDGYRRLPGSEDPVPGDLVLWIDVTDPHTEEIMHVARVLEVRVGAGGSPRVAYALSKWDAKSGEVIHNVYDVPFRDQSISFRMEYWTDRPVA